MTKLLVTGGAGFIGSAFVKTVVQNGYDVAVVDALSYAGDPERLKEITGAYRFHHIDITDARALSDVFEKEKPDIVIHFAAETHVDRSILDPTCFVKNNIEGTLNLLELSKLHKIQRFINISTDEVYGDLGADGSFTEDSPLKPNSPYSVSKAAADMLGRAYYRTFGLPVITIRPSNNYGPWQYPEKLIPVVIIKAVRNEPIPVYAQGLNVREWLFVNDCADAVLQIMLKGIDGEIYNLSSNIEKNNITVVKSILKLLGKPESLISFVKDRPGHDFRYSMDITKLKTQIGWSAQTTFEDGLQKTVKWYTKNFDWVQKKLAVLQDYWKKVYSHPKN